MDDLYICKPCKMVFYPEELRQHRLLKHPQKQNPQKQNPQKQNPQPQNQQRSDIICGNLITHEYRHDSNITRVSTGGGGGATEINNSLLLAAQNTSGSGGTWNQAQNVGMSVAGSSSSMRIQQGDQTSWDTGSNQTFRIPDSSDGYIVTQSAAEGALMAFNDYLNSTLDTNLTIEKPQSRAKKSYSPKRKNAGQSGNGRKAQSPKANFNNNPTTSISTSKKGKGPIKKSLNGNNEAAGNGATSYLANRKRRLVVASKSYVPPSPVKKKNSREDIRQKLKLYVGTMPGTDYYMPNMAAVGSYTNRHGQQVWVCLVCKVIESDDVSGEMICCEMCDDWYHCACVRIRERMREEDPWYCKRCIFQASVDPRKDFPKIFKNDLF